MEVTVTNGSHPGMAKGPLQVPVRYLTAPYPAVHTIHCVRLKLAAEVPRGKDRSVLVLLKSLNGCNTQTSQLIQEEIDHVKVLEYIFGTEAS